MVKMLEKEDVDLIVDAGVEDEVCRVAGMFDKEVGRLVKILDKEDVDLLLDSGDEDEVCRVVEIFDEEVG